jgi:hypothetical protein
MEIEGGFIGVTFNSAPNIFRVDYTKFESGFGTIHFYGSDYKAGFGGTFEIRSIKEIKANFGYGFRFGINITKLSGFDLIEVYPDSLFSPYRSHASVSSFSFGFGGSLWTRVGPFIIQPFLGIKPISTLIMGEEGATGWSLYLGYETGLELQIPVSEKVHFLLGAGFAGILKKEHKFDMRYEDYQGNVVYVTESERDHEGFLTKNSYGFFSFGLLIRI